MLARHFMFKQVYFHHIRRAYDIHLKDFLVKWLPSGKFSTDIDDHLKICDAEIQAAIRKAYEDKDSSEHSLSRRLQCREHFRRFYEPAPSDTEGGKLIPRSVIADAAKKQFDKGLIRYDYVPPKAIAPSFPVLTFDNIIVSSLQRSPVLAAMPKIGIDRVYCDKSIETEAIKWRDANKKSLLGLQ